MDGWQQPSTVTVINGRHHWRDAVTVTVLRFAIPIPRLRLHLIPQVGHGCMWAGRRLEIAFSRSYRPVAMQMARAIT